MVLNVVHDLGDTVLVSREQGAGYNRVQAVEDLQRGGDAVQDLLPWRFSYLVTSDMMTSSLAS